MNNEDLPQPDNEADQPNRYIPQHIRHEVRQRCGFGCVVCGLPFYEYEHMLEWAVVKRHEADEITLLCPQHHREKTYGWLTKEKVAECNARPFNKTREHTATYNLHFSGEKAEVNIGDNKFTVKKMAEGDYLAPLVIDDLAMIEFVLLDNQLYLNLIAFDIDGNVIIEINKNELVHSTSFWDIKMEGTTLTIREKLYQILVEIEFSPPNSLTVTRGRFLRNGVEAIISPKKIFVKNTGSEISGNVGEYSTGIVLGTKTKPRTALFELPIPGREHQKKIPADQFLEKRNLSVFQRALLRPRHPAVHKFTPGTFINRTFINETIPLDYSKFLNCKFTECELQIHGYEIPVMIGCETNKCKIIWDSEAGNTLNIIIKLMTTDDTLLSKDLSNLFTAILKERLNRLDAAGN